MTPEHHVVLQDIQHSTHLREDKNSRSLGLHGGEKLVEDDHLSGVLDDVLVGRVGRSRFLFGAKVGERSLAPSERMKEGTEEMMLTAPSKTEMEEREERKSKSAAVRIGREEIRERRQSSR